MKKNDIQAKLQARLQQSSQAQAHHVPKSKRPAALVAGTAVAPVKRQKLDHSLARKAAQPLAAVATAPDVVSGTSSSSMTGGSSVLQQQQPPKVWAVQNPVVLLQQKQQGLPAVSTTTQQRQQQTQSQSTDIVVGGVGGQREQLQQQFSANEEARLKKVRLNVLGEYRGQVGYMPREFRIDTGGAGTAGAKPQQPVPVKAKEPPQLVRETKLLSQQSAPQLKQQSAKEEKEQQPVPLQPSASQIQMEKEMELLRETMAMHGTVVDAEARNKLQLDKLARSSPSNNVSVNEAAINDALASLFPADALKLLQSIALLDALNQLHTFSLSPLACSKLVALVASNDVDITASVAEALLPYLRGYQQRGAAGIDEFIALLSNKIRRQQQHPPPPTAADGPLWEPAVRKHKFITSAPLAFLHGESTGCSSSSDDPTTSSSFWLMDGQQEKQREADKVQTVAAEQQQKQQEQQEETPMEEEGLILEDESASAVDVQMMNGEKGEQVDEEEANDPNELLRRLCAPDSEGNHLNKARLLQRYCAHRPDILDLFAPNFGEQVQQLFSSKSAIAQELITRVVHISSIHIVHKAVALLLASVNESLLPSSVTHFLVSLCSPSSPRIRFMIDQFQCATLAFYFIRGIELSSQEAIDSEAEMDDFISVVHFLVQSAHDREFGPTLLKHLKCELKASLHSLFFNFGSYLSSQPALNRRKEALELMTARLAQQFPVIPLDIPFLGYLHQSQTELSQLDRALALTLTECFELIINKCLATAAGDKSSAKEKEKDKETSSAKDPIVAAVVAKMEKLVKFCKKQDNQQLVARQMPLLATKVQDLVQNLSGRELKGSSALPLLLYSLDLIMDTMGLHASWACITMRQTKAEMDGKVEFTLSALRAVLQVFQNRKNRQIPYLKEKALQAIVLFVKDNPGFAVDLLAENVLMVRDLLERDRQQLPGSDRDILKRELANVETELATRRTAAEQQQQLQFNNIGGIEA